MGAGYVAALYLVGKPGQSRNDPDAITRRAAAVTAVTLAAPVALRLMGDPSPGAAGAGGRTVMEHIGIFGGVPGPIRAAVGPVALNVLLFAGPLAQRCLDGEFAAELAELVTGTAISIRNFVVAPVTEEIVFRGCMVPLLRSALGSTPALWFSAETPYR